MKTGLLEWKAEAEKYTNRNALQPHIVVGLVLLLLLMTSTILTSFHWTVSHKVTSGNEMLFFT